MECGAQHPQIFWDLLHAYNTHRMRSSNQILHGDQTRCEQISVLTMPSSLAKIFGDKNANM